MAGPSGGGLSVRGEHVLPNAHRIAVSHGVENPADLGLPRVGESARVLSAGQVVGDDVELAIDATLEEPEVSLVAVGAEADFEIADLRQRAVGTGFSWGRAGPSTKLRRFGTELLFAVEKKKPLIRRLFGR